MYSGTPSPGSAGTYTGTRASYVALSAITILALALLCSIWTSEVSGTVALLGLLSIYLASQELLVLYMIFAPASILVDIIRLAGVPHTVHGRGWLVFLSLLEMTAKVAGAIFAWSLHKSVASGESLSSYPGAPTGPLPGGSTYQRVEDPFATAYAPPHNDISTPAAGVPVGSSSNGPRQQQQHQQPTSAVAAPAAPHHELV